MQHRTASAAVLGITALTLAILPGCSPSSPARTTTSSSDSAAPRPDGNGRGDAVLSSPELAVRLLDENDLVTGYTRKPDRPSGGDADVTVLGCPALDDLGADAATGSGGGLDFPRSAKTAFTYTGSGEVTEELYSDAAIKLSDGTGRIFDAMTGCPAYQVLAGSTPVDIATQEAPAPRLGDERWSHLLTFSSGGAETVVKQTAIRDGSVLLIVSGSPALVDRHLDTALAKATATG
ncbi:hypothetical protein OG501_03715 [Streptomyces niveus]|uniref:hypothetical protein n=1 Tax=Streptomyces niveus TaxID=193462 RepID=UPI002E307032|nr:hypothetical protein [Streptomyces niveus]